MIPRLKSESSIRARPAHQVNCRTHWNLVMTVASPPNRPHAQPPLVPLIEYEDASERVRAVYDDIMRVRNSDWINNFWKAAANHPDTLERTWESLKQVMGPGALDPLTKQLIYIAVSVVNGCNYCTYSHTAAARGAGMSDEMFGELLAVIGMANETNALVEGYKVPVDEAFLSPG